MTARISLRRRLAGGAVAIAIAAGIAIAPAAQAAPVAPATAVASASAVSNVAAAPTTSFAPTGLFGDWFGYGDVVWSSNEGVPFDPKHDPKLAVIPFCNPIKLVSWLYYNFGDHFRDIGNALKTGKIFEIVKAIPAYAWADTKFHVPATIRHLGGCLSFSG